MCDQEIVPCPDRIDQQPSGKREQAHTCKDGKQRAPFGRKAQRAGIFNMSNEDVAHS